MIKSALSGKPLGWNPMATEPKGHPAFKLRWSFEESLDANEEWGANCGPHSLAAISGKTLTEIRAFVPGFRGWMNPTMIGESLKALGVRYRIERPRHGTMKLENGINRVQWEGPWLNPGVPARVAYFHTHWVAYVDGWALCTVIDPSLWTEYEYWRACLVGKNRPYHITHHYRIDL